METNFFCHFNKLVFAVHESMDDAASSGSNNYFENIQ